MGILNDDAVLIEPGKNSGDPTMVTVNCPDESGLGSTLCRIILEFGLSITKADFSTDGRWCYIVFWVSPDNGSSRFDWDSLKNRLLSACPSCLGSYYSSLQSSNVSKPPSLYLLKFFCRDRKGLLHDVTKVLTELEFTIQRVKVTTTPDGRVLDMFFITDAMDLLHTKQRQTKTCDHLTAVLGEHGVSCEIELAGPELESLQRFSSLPPEAADELFGSDVSSVSSKVVLTVDNHLSPAHTLLHINCLDQKGLFYDILRTSKDCDVHIAYGRFSSKVKGYRNLDLFVRGTDGKKIADPKHQDSFCSRLKEEISCPLRVIIVNRGPDSELLVANPVELSGKGRPRVFYDVTLALKSLGICIFSAEIGRHSTLDRQWEVYRFLLEERRESPLASLRARNQVVDKVTKTLMGW
ncbi:ACT domain-containing protein ACR9 [Raphanus sativus]|uniref:ACT domain-containing protein ACR n=1 Tax=Raphanus sativus TaxID=3726 RepID=A0A6J0NJX1_RAPSA|nr:ACT domain-containing protein ACR9 [Raphanus sativus]KAJ4903917.1 ACT domain-containing protein ACR9 [Raphanus sativus]